MEAMCRNELGYQPVNIYLNVTCALCYIYTFHSADHEAYPLTYVSGGFLQNGKNSSEIFLPTVFDRFSAVFSVAFPIAGAEIDHDAELWKECCQAAADCCAEQLKIRNDGNGTEFFRHKISEEENCPMTWDGWQCWDQTKKGQKAVGPCPKHINPVSSPMCSSGSAEKQCTEYGTWFRLESSDGIDTNFSKEWTNYTSCFNLTPLEHRYQVQLISYCISILFLVPALLIFWRCRQLHVQRNLIHVNFFLSLLMYAIMLIISQATITHRLFADPEIFVADFSGTFECRLVYTLTTYLRLCNYCWMFCEGLFLLRHLSNVFMREQRFFLYILCGWGFPSVPVGIYISLRSTDTGCWMEPKENLEWILKGPALLTLALNFFFLWYIVCLLVKKLQSRYVSEIEKFRKSCRAVLVLLPLFGLHFVITAYRPSESCGLQWYFLLNVALDGLQGVFVSLTFCYSNCEVIALGKRTFNLFHKRTVLTRSVSGRSGGSSSSGATATSADAPTFISRSVSTVSRMTRTESFTPTKPPPRTRKLGRSQLCRFESLMDQRNNIEISERKNLLQLSKIFQFSVKNRESPSE